ncbi:hypothetical protein CUTA107171_10160 [Cupriavidus taiwanensis]
MKILPPLDQLSDLDLDWWIGNLPGCFHRTELRVERSRRNETQEKA